MTCMQGGNSSAALVDFIIWGMMSNLIRLLAGGLWSSGLICDWF